MYGQDLTDFLRPKEGVNIDLSVGKSVRNLNLSCEGMFEEVRNWLQLAWLGVDCYSKSMKGDSNYGAKHDVCSAYNWQKS